MSTPITDALARLLDEGIEYHAWPPAHHGGQRVTCTSTGVLAVHVATGLAIVETSERSQLHNRTLAGCRLRTFVAEREAQLATGVSSRPVSSDAVSDGQLHEPCLRVR